MRVFLCDPYRTAGGLQCVPFPVEYCTRVPPVFRQGMGQGELRGGEVGTQRSVGDGRENDAQVLEPWRIPYRRFGACHTSNPSLVKDPGQRRSHWHTGRRVERERGSVRERGNEKAAYAAQG